MTLLFETQLKTGPQTFTVTYLQPAGLRLPPKQGVLEERLFHKIFLATHIPAAWGPWKLAAGLLAAALLVWLIWWPVSAFNWLAAAIYLLFALLDWLLLWRLPRAGRSFGPVGPQLYVKTAPRLGVAALAAVIAWAVGQPAAGFVVMIALQLAGTAIYLWGMWYEPFALSTTYQSVQSPRLPPDSPPLKLLHLSDLHIERLTRRESQILVALVAQANADIIVITGDYVNLSYVNDPITHAHVRQVLAQLSAPYGVYATLGSPPVDVRHIAPTLFEGLNIRLLRDEIAVLSLAEGHKLSLLGLDCEHDLESDASAFAQLIELAPADSMRVLLYHSPELMPLVQQYPVDLYLCGHTHGGQVRLPFYGAVVTSAVTGKRYEMGPYKEQNTQLYVSRGIGLEGLSAPRLRLFCPPEIILFTLSGQVDF